jgi:hypothetical protein
VCTRVSSLLFVAIAAGFSENASDFGRGCASGYASGCGSIFGCRSESVTAVAVVMLIDGYGWLWSWSFFWFWLHVPAARTTFRQWVCTTAAPTAVLGVWRELVLLPHAVVCVAHVTVALVPLTRSPVRRQQRKHMHVIPIEALCVLHPCVVDTGNTVAVRASGVRLAVASLLSRMRC